MNIIIIQTTIPPNLFSFLDKPSKSFTISFHLSFNANRSQLIIPTINKNIAVDKSIFELVDFTGIFKK